MSLHLSPIDIKKANAYVACHHRHHGVSQGMKFAVAVKDHTGVTRGVAIASKPRNRDLMKGGYLEVVRVCTDGTPNACSMLYSAMRRAGTALGYEQGKIITYTLRTEPGTSLHAAGWVKDKAVVGEGWDRPGRTREAVVVADKVRWHA